MHNSSSIPPGASSPRKSPYPPLMSKAGDDQQVRDFLHERFKAFHPDSNRVPENFPIPILKEHVERVDVLFDSVPAFWNQVPTIARLSLRKFVSELPRDQRKSLGKVDFGVISLSNQWRKDGQSVEETVPRLISLLNDFAVNPEQVELLQDVADRLEPICNALPKTEWASPRKMNSTEARSETRKSLRQTPRSEVDVPMTTATFTTTTTTTKLATSTTTTKIRSQNRTDGVSQGVMASLGPLSVSSTSGSSEPDMPAHMKNVYLAVVEQLVYLNEVYKHEVVFGLFAVLSELKGLTEVAQMLSQDGLLEIAVAKAKLSDTQKEKLKLAGQGLVGNGQDWNGDDLISNVIRFLSSISAKLKAASS
jgi:hypothetical protein